MKRYLVFAGDDYYPYGGWGDFKNSFDTLEDGLECCALLKADWWQIVDTNAGAVVWDSTSGINKKVKN